MGYLGEIVVFWFWLLIFFLGYFFVDFFIEVRFGLVFGVYIVFFLGVAVLI